MTDTGVIPIQDRTTRDNPWPGLRSYDEDEHDFFHGRPREAVELIRLVKRDVLTVFFGISGIGKSSLLKAGLFPALRENGYLPIRVRLNFADDNADFGRDVIRELEAEAARRKLSLDVGTEPLAGTGPETMWEYLHRVRVWEHADLLTPVFVFDQFEEVFTLGGATRAVSQVSAFLTELADLVENQIPTPVRRRIEESRRPSAFPFDGTPYRVVLALREDYLANLEGLVPQMPSLSKRNRFRLLPMSKGQALDAVLKPGAGVIEEAVAKQIVETIGFKRRSAGAPAVAALNDATGNEDEIEPFLLSLVCRELNARRQERRLPRITSDLVQSSQGGVGSILSDFYERCFGGLPPAVRVFVEDQLVGRTGFRQMVALEDLRETPAVLQAIPTLVARRLLRIEEDRHGVERVELTHDVLTPMAVDRRNRRLVQEQADRAWQAQRAARRRQLVPLLLVLLGLAVGGLGVAIWQWFAATKAAAEADASRLAAEQQLEATQAAQRAATDALQAAQDALQAYDRLKQANPTAATSAPPAASDPRQLQDRAQTELASSNRIGSYLAKGGAAVAQTTQALTSRVYFQVRNDREAERAKQTLIPLLEKAGFLMIPTPEILKTGPSNTEIRYFRANDRDEAEHIARILHDAGVTDAQAKYVQGFEQSSRIRENHFEVWLAPSDRSS